MTKVRAVVPHHDVIYWRNSLFNLEFAQIISELIKIFAGGNKSEAIELAAEIKRRSNKGRGILHGGLFFSQ